MVQDWTPLAKDEFGIIYMAYAESALLIVYCVKNVIYKMDLYILILWELSKTHYLHGIHSSYESCFITVYSIVETELVTWSIFQVLKTVFQVMTRWVIDTVCFVCYENHDWHVEHILSKSLGCLDASQSWVGHTGHAHIWNDLQAVDRADPVCLKI